MLITGNTPGNDMRFYWERVEGTRNFANKIWNASRFALMNMEGYDKDAELAPYTLADKWILSRLQDTVKDVTGLLERFELGEAGRAITILSGAKFATGTLKLPNRAFTTKKLRLNAQPRSMYWQPCWYLP